MRALLIIAVLMLVLGIPGSADAKPPNSCDPWPACKEGDDGSGDTSAFSENCKDLSQWTVTGNWSVSRGECSAKNTDAEHVMETTGTIDLSGALDATFSYKYRIESDGIDEFMRVSVSSNGGASFTVLKEYLGSESGTVSLSLADHVVLTDQMKLRASCLVSANNEVCAWDNIKIETVTDPPNDLLVTIESPQARTYGSADFPLTYTVSLNHLGTVDYSLNDGPLISMTADEGSSGTFHRAVENVLANGSYTFRAYATDDLGNTNDTQSVTFNVDTLAPAVEFVAPTPPSGSTQSNPDIPVKLATNSGSDHYAFVDFDSDLYLWMRMEDVVGDVVIDSSSHGNDGVAEGDASWNPNGKFGAAFEFDGINHGGGVPTDRIVIPGFQDRYPIFDSSFTAMAWARPDINEKMVIVGTKSITNLPGWHLRTSGGNHRLRMGVNTGYTSETAAYAEARTPMTAGVWVHVAGTYDPSVPSIQLYLDGELIDTAIDGVSALGYGNDLELAIAVPEDPQKAWDGLVDEVLIFNRVLDGDEIKAIYDAAANQYQNTYPGLTTGVHEFVGFSVNAAGSQDQTEVRDVTIN
jgi:hypothetical protein